MPSFRHGHLARKRGRRLEDRVAFAKRISGMLGREELDNALAAVHNNWNQGFDTIVGWNLIFEYLFKKEGAERGFKEYNDVSSSFFLMSLLIHVVARLTGFGMAG